MGSDWRINKIYVGDSKRDRPFHGLPDILEKKKLKDGFREVDLEEDSNWSYFLIEEGARWLHFADLGKNEHLDEFPLYISEYFPLIQLEVSDSAALRITLFENNEMKDIYMNMQFPFYSFETEEEASVYKGDFNNWVPYLDENRPVEIEEVWLFPTTKGRQKSPALSFDSLFDSTHLLFGWNKELGDVGYSHDFDGIPERGLSFLENGQDDAKQLDDFTIIQRHYQYPNSDKDYISLKNWFD